MSVQAVVPFNGNPNNRSKTENAATGVGAAGATAAYASNKAAKNGVFAKVGSAATKTTEMTKKTADLLTLTSKEAGRFKKLGAAFRIKKAQYIEDFTKLAAKVKNYKFIGKVLNSPITKKASAAFGGALAFFVLVPSILSMVDVVSDISNRS